MTNPIEKRLDDQRYDMSMSQHYRPNFEFLPHNIESLTTKESVTEKWNKQFRHHQPPPNGLGVRKSKSLPSNMTDLQISVNPQHQRMADTQMSSLSTPDIAVNGHNEDMSRGRLYRDEDGDRTVLIVRPRQRSFMKKVLGRSSPEPYGLPALESSNAIRDLAANLDCIGFCAGNSAFDEEVEQMHSKYERRANGEDHPVEVRLEHTHKLFAEEKWRQTLNQVIYPQLRDDGHVTRRVRIGVDSDRD